MGELIYYSEVTKMLDVIRSYIWDQAVNRDSHALHITIVDVVQRNDYFIVITVLDDGIIVSEIQQHGTLYEEVVIRVSYTSVYDNVEVAIVLY